MKVDVVIPARRTTVDRLIFSLQWQTRPPDTILVVSNEVRPRGHGVRSIEFTSDVYAVGRHDVALRRNIGIWESDADLIVFQDDDQMASPGMIEACIERTEKDPFVWGHHRYLDFGGKPWREIMMLPPDAGRSRESEPNREHGWQSCYAGMMAARRDFLLDVGGFDMMFMGDHAGEDQQLGRRMLAKLDQTRSFIYEPPFAWHPEEKESYLVGVTNLCPDGSHEMYSMWHNGSEFSRCQICPLSVLISDVPEGNEIVVPYDHSRVTISATKKEN